MSITTEILRIKGGKSDIRTLAVKKNMGTIPTTARIDDYAQYLNEHFPNFTYGVTYDGTKIRGKTEKWNQLCNGRDIVVTVLGVKYTISNNKIIRTGTATGSGGRTSFSTVYRLLGLKEGHKYLNPYGFHINMLGNVTQEQIFTSNITGEVSFGNNVIQGQTYNDTFYLTIIDLTDIFRAGNEPTSIDDERSQKLIAYAKDHPEYDTGSLAYSFYKGTKLGEYDYIDTANTKLVLGGAEVDISQMSLTRFLFGSNYLFYGTNNDQETNTTNIISADYQTVASISDIPDMSVTGNGGTGKNLWFRDDSCTTVEQFKTKNAGKKIYYKLATPIEIDLS